MLFSFSPVKSLYPRHARAGHHRRSAAGGGCSEAVMAQRSKLRAAPRRRQFRAPQEGKQVLLPLPKRKKRLRVLFSFSPVKSLYPRHARAGHHRRSAAGGGCSEAVMAQRSKLRAAPRRRQFRAPQEGKQVLLPLPPESLENTRFSRLFFFDLYQNLYRAKRGTRFRGTRPKSMISLTGRVLIPSEARYKVLRNCPNL